MKFAVLTLALAAASTTAFAGGMEEPINDATVAAAVTQGASSSNLPWWAVAAGVVAVGVALSNSN
jgi:hypothetical protein